MHYDDAKFTSAPRQKSTGSQTRRGGAWPKGRVCRIGGGVCDAFNANKLCYALCKII